MTTALRFRETDLALLAAECLSQKQDSRRAEVTAAAERARTRTGRSRLPLH